MEDLTNDDWYTIICALSEKAQTLDNEADLLIRRDDQTLAKELRRAAERHHRLALYIEEHY